MPDPWRNSGAEPTELLLWCGGAGPSSCIGKYGTMNEKHWRLRTGAGVLELKDNE